MSFSNKEKTRSSSKYGPWALITRASSGIGKELAIRLAEAGMHLVIIARNEDRLIQLSDELSEQFGVEVISITADLANEREVQQVIQRTQNLEIGLFIASAGFGTSGSFLTTSVHEEVNMLRVNIEALLTLTHHFSQRFAQQKRGGMILMSSMVGFQGVPFAANYAASKAYVQSLAEALGEELKPLGVDVLAAAPGPVRSGFGQRANMKMDAALTPEQVALPILKALGRKRTVLPGLLTKVLVYSLRTVPRWGKVKIMEKVMGGMTSHQRAI